MANLQYVRKNRIREEMAASKSVRRKRIIKIGGPFALVLSLIYPSAFLVCVGVLLIALLTTVGNDPVRESGASGEDYTLNVLKLLPMEYVIFNQLELPDERSRTGFRELDFVVCGPNGVFVVESKNHNGVVEGHENDKEWTIHKIGRGGTAYSSSIRNPVRQAKQQVHVLGNYLKTKNMNEWVTGLVALSSNNDLERITSSSVQVVKACEVASIIQTYAGRGGRLNLEGTVAALAGIV